MRTRPGWTLLLLAALGMVAPGCADEGGGAAPDTGDIVSDAGADAGADVGVTDTGEMDAADTGAADVADAGGADTGTVDTVTEDAMDGGPGDTGPTDTGPTDTGPADVTDTGPLDTGPDVVTPTETVFEVTIENLSARSFVPTPMAPGVWAVYGGANPLFAAGEPDPGLGLEALAEDANPAALASVLEADEAVLSGVFDVPVGAVDPGPILPGDTFSFTFATTPDKGRLSFATMVGQSNDLFVSDGPDGLELFDQDGVPLGEREVSGELQIWDAGTEVNEPPALGPWQAPRQLAPNSGPAESVVHAFGHTTRAVPPPQELVSIGVEQGEGPSYTITVMNVSADMGTLVTPIAPVYYATHDATFALFEEGAPASAGLEPLAEEGDPSELVGETTGATGTGEVGAATEPQETPGTAGPALPGQSFAFTVNPTEQAPFLSIASMVGQTNDVFIALPAPGVRLLAPDGTARPAEDVQTDIAQVLAVWDAGTEANEVPGVGLNQAPRQATPNQGPDDPTAGVRRYDDSTNDLAGDDLGGFATLTVRNAANPGDFLVTLTNTSGATAYPGKISPTLWVLDDGTLDLFEMGQPAPAALEALAEDGNSTPWVDELTLMPEVTVGVLDTPAGGAEAGPLDPGESYSGTITVTPDRPYLKVLAMVAPSNDTFLSLGTQGIPLLDGDGNPRLNADIALDIATALRAFDAGTEANQAAAAGRDQTPYQQAPNTGAPEGDGTVRPFSDPVWLYPPVTDLVRVTIAPVTTP